MGAEDLTTKLPIKPNYSVHRHDQASERRPQHKERWDDLHNKQDMHSRRSRSSSRRGEASGASVRAPYQNEWEIVNEDNVKSSTAARDSLVDARPPPPRAAPSHPFSPRPPFSGTWSASRKSPGYFNLRSTIDAASATTSHEDKLSDAQKATGSASRKSSFEAAHAAPARALRDARKYFDEKIRHARLGRALLLCLYCAVRCAAMSPSSSAQARAASACEKRAADQVPRRSRARGSCSASLPAERVAATSATASARAYRSAATSSGRACAARAAADDAATAFRGR